ncbi:MAG: glycosyltransferase [Acidobacteria bacterium]|nr:glycosyltransferase [Acidobacteriota bacterium]MBV9067836.1 glycosyltransferase [Acidobacteriota bacterium]MBV9186221.1 glycosyltransferase [Acidobacteriota bacterium]
MLVSIVTPSYQQARFIERTLESVSRQEGGVEHIVMDGGSTDGTVEILERWRDRISFSSGRDGGQTAAINAGIVRARGEILGYLNSDDVYYEGAIAAAVDAFERDPAADVVYGDAVHIDAGDRIIGAYPVEEWSIDRLELVCFLCQPAVFFRRRVVERFGPFDARLNYCMDYEYWLRLGMNGARFVHIPMRLAASRVHDETKTRTRPREAHAEINNMLRETIGHVPDNWLWNYAHAVLDARGVARSTDRSYLLRAALLTAAAAVRWNGFPSMSLLRGTGSWFLHGSSFVTRPAEPDA